MKNLHSKKITKQIILIIAIIMLCNFTMPLFSYAVSTESGGSEETKVSKFLCFIPDVINKLLMNMFIDPNEIYNKTTGYYSIRYSPAIIFSGLVPGLNANFLHPIEDKTVIYYDFDASGDSVTYYKYINNDDLTSAGDTLEAIKDFAKETAKQFYIDFCVKNSNNEEVQPIDTSYSYDGGVNVDGTKNRQYTGNRQDIDQILYDIFWSHDESGINTDNGVFGWINNYATPPYYYDKIYINIEGVIVTIWVSEETDNIDNPILCASSSDGKLNITIQNPNGVDYSDPYQIKFDVRDAVESKVRSYYYNEFGIANLDDDSEDDETTNPEEPGNDETVETEEPEDYKAVRDFINNNIVNHITESRNKKI